MGSAPYPRDRAAASGTLVEDGAMGSTSYVQSLSPIVLSIEVASVGSAPYYNVGAFGSAPNQ
jgi:hypothetical protein